MRSVVKQFLLFLAAIMCANGQMRNSVTFGAGFAHNIGNTGYNGDSAPSFALTYAYRVVPHLDVEAGAVGTSSLGTEVRGASYDVKADDHLLWVPFGIRGVLPLRGGRVEISAGGGGTYEKYFVGNPTLALGFVPRTGWGGYAVAGAAVALDEGKRFWLSASPRFLFANTNRGYSDDRWFALNVGLGVRF